MGCFTRVLSSLSLVLDKDSKNVIVFYLAMIYESAGERKGRTTIY